MSFRITFAPPQFWYSYLSVSAHLLSLLHRLQSFSPHILTISVSRLLIFFVHLCHTCICSYFFIPDLLGLFIPIIHLNFLISVFSSQLCSAFLSAQVSLPYMGTDLMMVLHAATLSIISICIQYSIVITKINIYIYIYIVYYLMKIKMSIWWTCGMKTMNKIHHECCLGDRHVC